MLEVCLYVRIKVQLATVEGYILCVPSTISQYKLYTLTLNIYG